MVISFDELKGKYKDISDIKGKVAREINSGNLIRLVKGIYESNKDVDGVFLSQYILSPSYLSFEYILSFYELIPEGVSNVYTCATSLKRKDKIYKNYFGIYWYRDIPLKAYPYGIKAIVKDNYSFTIASKEKALCDKLYVSKQVRSIKDLKELLFNDLRIDIDNFKSLNKDDLLFLAPLYETSNLNLLVKLLKE